MIYYEIIQDGSMISARSSNEANGTPYRTLEITQKEAAVAYFKVISRHFSD
jgi:hypothetical protein